jgi:catechol 2,3-dioxygenase-like lactoylglutathione lyase family enzyme
MGNAFAAAASLLATVAPVKFVPLVPRPLYCPDAAISQRQSATCRSVYYSLCHHVRRARPPAINRGKRDMTLKRMDNVLIVVDDLEAVKAFFIELGLKLEGETTVEGPMVGTLIGLKDVRATLAMMRTPDGQGIELDKFHTPDAIRFGPVDAPMNTLGIRRVMFAVDDIDAIVARMRAHGAEIIGEMQYGDTYRLAYIRGPEGIIIALAEQCG